VRGIAIALCGGALHLCRRLPFAASIQPCPLPADALLAKYAGSGAYTDCYALDVAGAVSHTEYVEAFYTGKTIKIELLLLDLMFSKPATDIQARQLAIGEIEDFSGWRVEARKAGQLLMCDLIGNTRSWLMVAPQSEGSAPATRLYFGSAVLSRGTKANGEPRMGALFVSLLWFHRLYSRLLLDDARARLLQISGQACYASALRRRQ
jgi:hypothetical protein